MESGDCVVIWSAAIAGFAALLGALGSQLIAGWMGLKSKRLDLFFKIKAEVYQQLMGEVGKFALDPTDQDKYIRFLNAYEAALVFASDEVAEALSGRTGINVNAQRLRVAEDEKEREKVRVTTWWESVKALTEAMRADLKRLSGGFL